MAASFPTASYSQIAATQPHKRHHWFLLVGILVVTTVLLGVIAEIQTPQPATCANGCPAPKPPSSGVLVSDHFYKSAKYGYTLAYSTSLTPDAGDTCVNWSGELKSNNLPVNWSFCGDQPKGRGAQQIVESLQSDKYSGAQLVYTIPGAEMGYHPGYGNVYDLRVTPATGDSYHSRVIIIAAVHKNLVVELYANAPYEKDTADHPNPAGTLMVDEFDDSVNSVTWPGDPQL